MQRLHLPQALQKKYRIGEKLGAGGMGCVFRAHHLPLDRPVAIKFLTGSILASERSRQRFENEAKICSRLNHPHIVTIYDYDIACEHPFIIFELLSGQSLGQMIADNVKTTVGAVIQIVGQIADALNYAHGHGIIHRDVKPDNIIVSADGLATLADFGIAKLGELTTLRTRTGVIMGTPLYLSPEQARGEKLTAAVDVYSLGVVLFQSLTGTVPFEAPSDLDTVLKHMHDEPPHLTAIEHRLPTELDSLVESCLRKDPTARPTAAELHRDLQNCQQSFGSDADNMEVVLGCRAGQLVAPFEEPRRSHIRSVKRRSRRNTSRQASDTVEKSSAVSTAPTLAASHRPAKSAAASSKRRWAALRNIRRLSLLVLAVVSLFVLYTWAQRKDQSGRVDSLSLVTVSGRGVVVSFAADWQSRRPEIVVSSLADRLPVATRLLRCSVEALTKGSMWQYTVALCDLTPESEYTVAIEKPDGTSSLPITIRTTKARLFRPTVRWYGSSTRELTLALEAEVPFIIKSGDHQGAGSFSGSHQCSISWDELARDGAFHRSMCSLDGEERVENTTLRAVLRRFLQRLADMCLEAHDNGDFYTRFRGKHGTANGIFREVSIELKKATQEGRSEHEVGRHFWNEVFASRMAGAQWYAWSVGLMPVLGKLREILDFEEQLVLKRCLVPLFLIARAADDMNLPMHPLCDDLLFVFYGDDFQRLGQTFIEAPTLERVVIERDAQHRSYPFHPIVDGRLPNIERCPGAVASRGNMYLRTRYVTVTAAELEGASRAELSIFVGNGFTNRLLRFDINDGTGVLLQRVPGHVSETFFDWAQKSGFMVKLAFNVIGGATDFTCYRDVLELAASVAPARESTVPFEREYNLRMPVSWLRPGKNVVRITMLMAPVQLKSFTLLGPVIVRVR